MNQQQQERIQELDILKKLLLDELKKKLEESNFYTIKTVRIRTNSIYLSLHLQKEIENTPSGRKFYFEQSKKLIDEELDDLVKFILEGKQVEWHFSEIKYLNAKEKLLKCTEVINITLHDLLNIKKPRGRPKKDPRDFNLSINQFI